MKDPKYLQMSEEQYMYLYSQEERCKEVEIDALTHKLEALEKHQAQEHEGVHLLASLTTG